jgi:hypothetical protein
VIPWKSQLVIELYLDIAIAFISRERKESKPSFLALLERDRENPEQF